MRTIIPLLAAALLAACGSAEQPRVAGVATFSVLGDSYSTFEGCVEPDSNEVWYKRAYDDPRTSDVTDSAQTWWSLLAADLRLRLLVNNSYSGATICRRGYNGDDYTSRCFLTRLDHVGEPDLLIVFGGTNDAWSGASMGQFDYDTFQPDSLYSFRPAMALLLKRLRESLPDTRLLVVINSEIGPDVPQSMKAIADHYGVQWLELSRIDKINGHPSIEGHRKIAEAVAAALADGK